MAQGDESRRGAGYFVQAVRCCPKPSPTGSESLKPGRKRLQPARSPARHHRRPVRASRAPTDAPEPLRVCEMRSAIVGPISQLLCAPSCAPPCSCAAASRRSLPISSPPATALTSPVQVHPACQRRGWSSSSDPTGLAPSGFSSRVFSEQRDRRALGHANTQGALRCDRRRRSAEPRQHVKR